MLVYLAALCLTVGLVSLPRVLPGMVGYSAPLTGLMLLWLSFRMLRRLPDGVRRAGVDLGGLLIPADADDPRPAGPLGLFDLGRALRDAAWPALTEVGVALATCALLFPPFIVGFGFWHAPERAFVLRFPDDPLSFWLTQLLVVALPEEAFFRGYIQTRLSDHWPRTTRLFGAELSLPAWLLQAVLFAGLHLVAIPDPRRLAVFFPGLVFGWLRARRGGIGAALLFHAACNGLADLLTRGWLLAP